VTEMSNMFDGATAFDQNIRTWVVNHNKLTNMFKYATAMQNRFGNITSFNDRPTRAFFGKTAITNGNKGTAVNGDHTDDTTDYGHISTWDTSAVTDMSELFKDKATFNEDISRWDVSAVTNMSDMFNGATAFDQDISGWTVSNVTDITRMFYNVAMPAEYLPPFKEGLQQ